MSVSIIQERLKNYRPISKQEEINALKEIYQEIALAGLARGEFFKKAAFQGGTALRIIHQLRRFSEDLDFVLLEPSTTFQWNTYLNAIDLEFQSFGVNLEVKDRSEAEGVIKKAFLKEDSFARILELKYKRLPSDEQKISIKLEIDINPPGGSSYETSFLTYPYPFSLLIQDLPSLFATKCHAILARRYDKGRDWFDFLWYLTHNVEINGDLLKQALFQEGPYKKQEISFDQQWLRHALEDKVVKTDWKVARRDVENFLSANERKFVESWSKDLFINQIKSIKVR